MHPRSNVRSNTEHNPGRSRQRASTAVPIPEAEQGNRFGVLKGENENSIAVMMLLYRTTEYLRGCSSEATPAPTPPCMPEQVAHSLVLRGTGTIKLHHDQFEGTYISCLEHLQFRALNIERQEVYGMQAHLLQHVTHWATRHFSRAPRCITGSAKMVRIPRHIGRSMHPDLTTVLFPQLVECQVSRRVAHGRVQLVSLALATEQHCRIAWVAFEEQAGPAQASFQGECVGVQHTIEGAKLHEGARASSREQSQERKQP
eukprot:4690099-Prymnesium_polylepis.2